MAGRGSRSVGGALCAVLGVAAGLAVPSSTAGATAAAVGPCAGAERVVWTGGTSGGDLRQVAVGDPVTGNVVLPSAGVSTLNGDVAVSPDGTHLAWIGMSSVSGAYEVFVADALGGGVVRVAPGTAVPTRTASTVGGTVTVGGDVRWAFDGARLAWISGAAGIAVAASDGSGVEILPQTAGADSLAWSKDGGLLAWHTSAGLWVGPPLLSAPATQLAGNGAVQLLRPDAFSPDGSQLVYQQMATLWPPVARVMVQPVGGGGAAAVGGDIVDGSFGWGSPTEYDVGWSGDGGRAVAWARGFFPGGLLGETDGRASGVLATLDGSGGVTLPGARDAHFSPDGRFFTGSMWSYFSAVAGKAERGAVGVWNRNGGFAGFLNRFPYIANRYVNVAPTWSPDGLTVAFEQHLHYPNSMYGFIYWDFSGSSIVVRRFDASTPLVNLGGGSRPVWLPSGNAVAATGGAAYPLSWDRDGVRVLRTDGTGVTSFADPVVRPTGVGVTSSAATDLQVSIAGPPTVTAGGTATVTVTVTNAAPCAANGVAVSGLVGAGSYPTAQTATTGSVARTGWVVGRLAPGASVQLTRTVQVTAPAGQSIGLGVVARSGTGEVDPSNDAGSWSATVAP